MVWSFLQSPEGKEWHIWKGEEESPLDVETYLALTLRFPKIPEKQVNMLSLFERNDTSTVKRSEIDILVVTLPALELRFCDPDNSGNYYIGFIEGRENLNKFLLEFARKYNEKYPFDMKKTIKEAKRY